MIEQRLFALNIYSQLLMPLNGDWRHGSLLNVFIHTLSNILKHSKILVFIVETLESEKKTQNVTYKKITNQSQPVSVQLHTYPSPNPMTVNWKKHEGVMVGCLKFNYHRFSVSVYHFWVCLAYTRQNCGGFSSRIWCDGGTWRRAWLRQLPIFFVCESVKKQTLYRSSITT